MAHRQGERNSLCAQSAYDVMLSHLDAIHIYSCDLHLGLFGTAPLSCEEPFVACVQHVAVRQPDLRKLHLALFSLISCGNMTQIVNVCAFGDFVCCVQDIKDSYELGSPLGTGGFAKVIKGRNKESGEDVAVKHITITECDSSQHCLHAAIVCAVSRSPSVQGRR